MSVVELLGLWFLLGLGAAGLLRLTQWRSVVQGRREMQVRARRDLR